MRLSWRIDNPLARCRRSVAQSNRCIPGYSRHAIEVRVVAGNVLNRLILHRRENKGIVGQQPMKLAKCGCQGRQMAFDGQDFDPEARNLVDCLAETGEFLNFRGILAKPARNSRQWPAKDAGGFKDHQLVGHLAQYVCRSVSNEVLPLVDPLHQHLTLCPKGWIRREVIHENVGIEKHRCIAGNLIERHGLSRTSNSGSRATRRTVSASPVQPMRPYALRTRSGSASMCSVSQTRFPSWISGSD